MRYKGKNLCEEQSHKRSMIQLFEAVLCMQITEILRFYNLLGTLHLKRKLNVNNFTIYFLL